MVCIPHQIPACRVCETYSKVEYKLSKNNQPKALQLANQLEQAPGYCFNKMYCESAAELRRLHELNQELLWSLRAAANYIDTLGGTSKSYRSTIIKAE
jgi:hypothetical protein